MYIYIYIYIEGDYGQMSGGEECRSLTAHLARTQFVTSTSKLLKTVLLNLVSASWNLDL